MDGLQIKVWYNPALHRYVATPVESPYYDAVVAYGDTILEAQRNLRRVLEERLNDEISRA